MSAWIVAVAHIDVLVLAGVQFEVPYDRRAPTAGGPAALVAAGTDLWAEVGGPAALVAAGTDLWAEVGGPAALVAAGTDLWAEVGGPAALVAAGTDLWAENHRSVDHRYGGRTEPSVYRAPTAEVILDRAAVVKAVDCFVYQCGEHPGWPASRAADYCRRVRAAAMIGLPLASADGRYPVGWDEAAWGIDRLDQAVAGGPAAVRATVAGSVSRPATRDG